MRARCQRSNQRSWADFGFALVGACLIAMIQNGTNLPGVESNTRQAVLGLVGLAAVPADTLRHGRRED